MNLKEESSTNFENIIDYESKESLLDKLGIMFEGDEEKKISITEPKTENQKPVSERAETVRDQNDEEWMGSGGPDGLLYRPEDMMDHTMTVNLPEKVVQVSKGHSIVLNPSLSWTLPRDSSDSVKFGSEKKTEIENAKFILEQNSVVMNENHYKINEVKLNITQRMEHRKVMSKLACHNRKTIDELVSSGTFEELLQYHKDLYQGI